MDYPIYKDPRLTKYSPAWNGFVFTFLYVIQPVIAFNYYKDIVLHDNITYWYFNAFNVQFALADIAPLDVGPSLIVEISKKGTLLLSEEYGLLDNVLIKFSKFEVHPEVVSRLVNKQLGLKHDT